jgi:hypothetical protein
VRLNHFTPEDLVGADAAVVAALGSGESLLGEAQRPGAGEEGVLLLEAEPVILVLELFCQHGAFGARIRRVRRHVDE